MILPVLLLSTDTGGLHLLQLGDVGICHAGGRQRGGNRIVVGGVGLVHRFPHTLGRLSQLVHRGNGVIGGGGGKSGDGGGHAGHGRSYAHDDIHTRDGCGEHGGCGGRDLRAHGVGGQGRDHQAQYPHEGSDGVDQGRILLDELGNRIEDLGAHGVGFLERRGVGVADGHLQVLVGVLHHGQLALGGGIPLCGLVDQGGVFVPGVTADLQGVGEHVAGAGRTEQGVTHTDVGQAHVVQNGDCAASLGFHIAEALDKLDDGPGRVLFKGRGKFGGGHTRHVRELLQPVAALLDGERHIGDQGGECGAAGLGLDADRGQGAGERHDLRLGHADLCAGTGDAHTHVHDLFFRRRQVVAQVNDGSAQPVKVLLGHPGDVRQTGEAGGRFVRGHVGRCAQHGHDFREAQQGLLVDAQLAGGFGDGRQLLGRRGDLRRHLLDGVRHGGQLVVGEVGGLGHAGHRRLEVHRRLGAVREVLIDLFQGGGDARRHDCLMDGTERLARLVPEGLRALGDLLLFLFQRVDTVGEPGGALPEVVHVDPSLFQGVAHLVQPLGLPIQGGGGLVNLLLLGEQLILQVSRKFPCLLDLLLDVVILLLKEFQALPGVLHRRLLFLVGGDVRLRFGEGLYLFLHGRQLVLGGFEGLAVAAAQLGVQLE